VVNDQETSVIAKGKGKRREKHLSSTKKEKEKERKRERELLRKRSGGGPLFCVLSRSEKGKSFPEVSGKKKDKKKSSARRIRKETTKSDA